MNKGVNRLCVPPLCSRPESRLYMASFSTHGIQKILEKVASRQFEELIAGLRDTIVPIGARTDPDAMPCWSEKKRAKRRVIV